MCTINFDQMAEPCEFLPDFTLYAGIKRASFQLEKGEKNGRLHWQIFLEFLYPVTVKSIINQTVAQGCKMHVSVDGAIAKRHPKAGRQYVYKGDAIDNHRYSYDYKFGWFEGHQPPIKSRIRPQENDWARPTLIANDRESAMECLKWQIKECQNYIKSGIEKSVEPVKFKII